MGGLSLLGRTKSNMTEIVLYGLTNRDGAESLKDIGDLVRANGGPTGTNLVEVGQIAAVVGPQNKWKLLRSADYNQLKRLQNYQTVLETAINLAPVLPARHQTVLPDKESVSILLAQHGHTLTKPIKKFGDFIEFEVAIHWDINDIVRSILGEEGLEVSPRDRSSRAMARSLDVALQDKRRVLVQFIRQALKVVSQDIIDIRDNDQSILCRMLVLLRNKDQDALLKILGQIDESGIGKLQMSCIGPLPPCSFASVEVWRSDVSKVDEARRDLSLNCSVHREDIRRAYHAALKTLHPDTTNQVHESHEAAERISAIRSSYELLSLIADGQVRGGIGLGLGTTASIDNSLVRLDPKALQRTYLVSLRREGETLASAA